MEQYIYNEQNGLWYEQRGDYYIPCLELPAEKAERSIGVWGQRHLQYIREHKKAFYTSLLTSGKLQSYLADVEEQAQELFDRLMKQRVECEGITETLKADNQMEWVQRMNALWAAVTETVNAEVIHLYLTAEERRYVFNALLAYRNKLLAQGRYTDLMDEVMIKLQK